MNIDALFEEIEQTRNAWVSLYERFANANYDVEADRPCVNQSVRVLHRRALLVFEIFASLRPPDAEGTEWVALAGFATDLQGEFRQLKTTFQPVVDQLAQHWREDTTIGDSSGNFALQLFAAGENIANFDVSAPFSQFHGQLLSLQARAGQLLPFFKASAIGDLSGRTTALADLTREAGILRGNAQKAADAATTSSTSAASQLKTAQEAVAQAEAILAKLQALQTQGDTNVGTVTALVEKIKAVGSGAESLEQQVSGYQAKFDAFQKQLDDRNAQFVKFETDTVAAEQKNRDRELEIDRLAKQADAMISGSTTAGLAKSMEDARRRYENRMFWARVGFLVSIGFLIASALPLAAHLLPGLLGSWVPTSKSEPETTPYSVLGKFLLLLPASWLTAFFTKSYADFFHLEREYAHKAALAMSVDGFKRQAPKYEEEITAEVFMEIRSNPASRPGPEAAGHPLYDAISQVLKRVLPKEGKQKGSDGD